MAVRRWLAMLVVVGMVFVTAACGDDDASDEGADGGADGDPSGEVDADDQAMADAAIITLDDLPSGWTEEAEDDEDDEDVGEELEDCLGTDLEDEFSDPAAEAESPSFNGPNEEFYEISITIPTTVDEARAGFELFASDDARACLDEVFRDEFAGEDLGDGVEVGDPSVERLSFVDVGDERTAYRFTIPMTAEGITLDVAFDMVLIRLDRAFILSTGGGVFAPFDPDQHASLIETALQRLDPADLN